MNMVTIAVQPLTRGHRKRLAKMGFPQFLQTKAAADAWDALSEGERDEAILAAVWLASQSIDDVKPGGKIYSAIEAEAWRRLFVEWEFTLTPAVFKSVPDAFRAALADDDAATSPPSFPALEPLPVFGGAQEVCEACQ
jgi:hypothetical protein